MRVRSAGIAILCGLAFQTQSAMAQGSFAPLIAIGPELSETNSPAPGSVTRTTGFSPGLTVMLGAAYLPANSHWSAELRYSRISRSEGRNTLATSAGQPTIRETRTRISGGSLSTRFEPSRKGWLRPYGLAGLGIYRVHHAEPTGVVPLVEGDRGATGVVGSSSTTTTGGILASAGLQFGRGRSLAFVELGLVQYLNTGARSRSLPLLFGFRI